jgi:DNA-binding IclR family transcriptional regulator
MKDPAPPEYDEQSLQSDPYQLQGLDRVVAILDLLGASNYSLSLAEICQHTGLHKSTAHRALMALERTGMIERVPMNRSRLGLKLYDMGSRAMEQIDLRSRVHPHLPADEVAKT